MQYSAKFLLVVLGLSLGAIGPCSSARAQLPAEASHVERFTPRAKSLEKAESELTAKLAATPGDAATLSSRGLLRLQLRQDAAGLEDLRSAVAAGPGNPQFHVNLAYGLLLTRNFQASADESRKTLTLEERNFAAHELLGRALLAAHGDRREAIEHLQRSLELNPDQTDLRFELVRALRAEKDYVAAGVQIRILKDMLPGGDARIEYEQGLLSADMGYPEAAAAGFRRALESNPDFLPARQDLGTALIRLEKWQEAADVLNPLTEAQPNSYLVAYLHALALENSHHSDEAEREAKRAVALNEQSPDAQTLLGITLSSRGRYDEAIAAFDRAVQLAPQSFDAQFYLGRARYARSDTAGAAAALEAAVKLRPSEPEARFLLGTVYEVSGAQDAAMQQYEELLRINPNDARGYLGLGELLSKAGRNDKALEQLQKAASLNPENFETNLALGRLLAKMGHLGEGISYLEHAAQESPDSPEVHYQLALSLQRAGRKAEAAKEFAEVDRLNRVRRGAPGAGAESPKP